MNSYNKKYNSFQIPKRSDNTETPAPPGEKASSLPHGQMDFTESYYEIEYDSCPMPGVGKYVLKSQKIEQPEKDEVRELFNQMRDIAREDRYLNFRASNFYDKKFQQDKSRIFYKQGIFMKDFEDTYEKQAPFSSYFPDYQMMGYEQLRTYFTWRAKVRSGDIADTALSYAFLYFYELLNNIGVENAEDGLNTIMSFWKAFRVYHQEVDKYVIHWLKDYHIYYDLPWSFREFIKENNLAAYYPKVINPDDNFDLYCSISKYDIRKSKFYNDDTIWLIRDCFGHVLQKLRDTLSEHKILLEDLLFRSNKNMTPWTPFQDALFYPGIRHRDKRVILSEKEIYVRSQNTWKFHTTITTESGKQLLAYLLKQMESLLRAATKYKYKLSAKSDTLAQDTAETLSQAGISIEKLVTEATLEFYREATKTVVKVNPGALDKIRQEALMTQERLIVPEDIQEEPSSLSTGQNGQFAFHEEDMPVSFGNFARPDPPIASPDSLSDPWECLKNALTPLEQDAVLHLWMEQENTAPCVENPTTQICDLKQFAQKNNIMLEVLIDGINEKAVDCIGDSLLDGDFAFYDDYIEQVKGMVKQIWQEKYPQESPIF